MNNGSMAGKGAAAGSGLGNIVSFSREILADLDTPLSCYVKLKNAYPSSPSFLLESVESKERLGRYSFIGFDPFLVFKSLGKKVVLSGMINEEKETEDPFEELRRIMNNFNSAAFSRTVGCTGGAVGYVGYDMVKFFEKLPDLHEGALNTWDMYFIFPKKLIIFDNYTRRMRLTVFRHPENDGTAESSPPGGMEDLDTLYGILRSPITMPKPHPFSVQIKGGSLSKEEFESIVLRAKEYILAGDVIQVVLSQRFTLETDADGLSLYRALRVVNPSPYMFLLDCGDYSLIGSSPETLVKMENGEIEVRPIAGTKRRGKDREEDDALARELLADKKELAEHIMLVDLGRNDVGRVSEIGSVTVPQLMDIEKYSHVMHIVSCVRGKVKGGADAFDVLRATFPAGTVSGAPKIRAMEIIEELEKERREFYAGCVGYFTYNGNMDFCITIRTLLKKGSTVYIQAGAGIVADSVPETEYMETIHKSQAMVKSITELKEIIG